jgi:hypothetical protein
MNHAKTSFSTEIFADAITSVAQYLALLRYTGLQAGVVTERDACKSAPDHSATNWPEDVVLADPIHAPKSYK